MDKATFEIKSQGHGSYLLSYLGPEGVLVYEGSNNSCYRQLEEWQARYENLSRAEERMEQKGLKFDQDKPRMDLLPYSSLEEIAKVLTFGAKKYTAGNWAKGLHYSRLISAAQRHIGSMNEGEDTDPESGLPHSAHAACCLLFLIWMQKNKPEMDDRWIHETKKKP